MLLTKPKEITIPMISPGKRLNANEFGKEKYDV